MQLDTGSTVSILPKTLYDLEFNQWPLHDFKVTFESYIGIEIPVYDEVHLPVSGNVLASDEVDGDGPPLLGRNWLKQLQLNRRSIFF